MSRAKPFIVKENRGRDWLIGGGAGILLIGFLALGIWSISSKTTDPWLSGTITAKRFTPQPEEQITIGKAGLNQRRLDGEYCFEVFVAPLGKSYTVWVDKSIYEGRKVGEEFRFLRPAQEPP